MSRRILHVTEAMTTGVLTFVDTISRRQADAGADVSVLYSVRDETASWDALRERLDDRVEMTAVDRGSGIRNTVELGRTVRRIARSGEVDVIHLHSSIAGGIGRIATLGTRQPVFFSPHGFAFLRGNTSWTVRQATRWVERVLARKGALIVTSGSEVDLAVEQLRAPRVHYLQSGVPLDSIIVNPRKPEGARLQVAMLGRLAYQKAPWRFAQAAQELNSLADFVWVGGGDPADIEKWIGDAPVTVLDWVSPDELESILQATDVLLFPSLWEGMSLSLIQAQGRGIPAVTTDVVGNRDTVADGETGFVRTDEAGLITATRTLLDDGELRSRMAEAATARVRAHFVDDAIGADSLAIYESLLAADLSHDARQQ